MRISLEFIGKNDEAVLKSLSVNILHLNLFNRLFDSLDDAAFQVVFQAAVDSFGDGFNLSFTIVVEVQNDIWLYPREHGQADG